MLLLKKIIPWLKSYWYIPLLALGGLIFVLFKKENPVDFERVLDEAEKSYKKELEVIEKNQKDKDN